MIAKAAYRPGGLVVDPVFAQQWRVCLRLDPGPKLDAPFLRFEFDRDSKSAASTVSRAVAQFRSLNSDPMQMGRSAGAYDALRIYPATIVEVMKDIRAVKA